MYKRPDGMYYPDEWFDVVKCNECGLGFVNPMPSFEDISKFYPDDFYDWFRDENQMDRYKAQYKYLLTLKIDSTPNSLLDCLTSAPMEQTSGIA